MAEARWYEPNIIFPTDARALAQVDIDTYFDDRALWRAILRSVDVFVVFRRTLALAGPGGIAEPFLLRLVEVLADAGVALGVATGGPYGDNADAGTSCAAGPRQMGIDSADIDTPLAQYVVDAGGTLAWLEMDGALRRSIVNGNAENCGWTMEQSATAAVAYMARFHESFPATRIGLEEDLVVWRYRGIPGYGGQVTAQRPDLEGAVRLLIAAAQAEGERLEFVHVDEQYEYQTGEIPGGFPARDDWVARSISLHRLVREYGIPFGRSHNSAFGGNPLYGQASDRLYQEQVLDLVALNAAADDPYGVGLPEHRKIISFHRYPRTQY